MPVPPPDADAAAAAGADGGDPHSTDSFVRHAVLVSAVTLISRITGLVRDLTLARLLGDTAVMSSLAGAFQAPNLFRRLFGEGALSAALIPEYAQLLRRDRSLADRFASLTSAALLVGTGVLTVVGELVLLVLLWLLPRDPDRDLLLGLTMAMLPFMPLVCVTAALGGLLQTHRVFGPAAGAPVILNVCIVIGAMLAWGLTDPPDQRAIAYAVAAATVASGFLQAAWALRALRGRMNWGFERRGVGGPARRLVKKFIPAVVSLGTVQLNAFVDTLIATWPLLVGPTVLGFAYPLDKQSNGVLFFAQRLYQFPLGVFAIAVATAVFPLLAHHADEPVRFRETLRRGVRLSLFIALPATAGVILVREDLVRALFTGGGSSFSEEGVARSAAILAGYAACIWAYSLNHLLNRAFFAMGDTRTPARVAVLMVGVNFALNVAGIWVIGERALAWATATTAAIQCGVLWQLLRGRIGPLDEAGRSGDTSRAIGVTVANSAAMAAAVALGLWAMSPAGTWGGSAARLVLGVVGGIGTYWLLSALTRRPELRWLLRREG